MLLIAQPKAASTSLVHTIADIARLNCSEGVPRKAWEINCEGFEEIQKLHSNMIERSSLFINNTAKGRKKIFKEHLLPTKRHIQILDKIKTNVVVLLRNPKHSFDSYLRMPKGKTFSKNLYWDLAEFNETYFYYSLKKYYILIITYEELIKDYNKTMIRILTHYKIKVPKNIPPLQRRKFTGVGIKRLKGNK